MEIHRQQCQACESFDVRNILVRQAGRPTVVYVRCQKCMGLVARYKLTEYYHHGKGIESYLRSLGAGGGDSARHFREEFDRAVSESVAGFEATVERLQGEGKGDD